MKESNQRNHPRCLITNCTNSIRSSSSKARDTWLVRAQIHPITTISINDLIANISHSFASGKHPKTKKNISVLESITDHSCQTKVICQSLSTKHLGKPKISTAHKSSISVQSVLETWKFEKIQSNQTVEASRKTNNYKFKLTKKGFSTVSFWRIWGLKTKPSIFLTTKKCSYKVTPPRSQCRNLPLRLWQTQHARFLLARTRKRENQF